MIATPYRRPLRRGDRAVADGPMVCRRRDAREARDRGGALGAIKVVPEDLEEDLFQLDGEYPALVRVAPALVGAPDPGLVWTETAASIVADGRGRMRRRRPARASSCASDQRRARHAGSPPRSGRSPRWAGPTETATDALTPLSQRRADLRLRHPVLLGCAHDRCRACEFMKEVPFRTPLSSWPCPRDADGQKMSKSKGNTVDPLGLIDQVWRGRAALLRWRRWKARAATSSSMRSASRAIATSRPSSGTPRASPVQRHRRERHDRAARRRTCRSIAGSSPRWSRPCRRSTSRLPTCRFDERGEHGLSVRLGVASATGISN